eukprot:GAHX01004569.1.p1 GENE.GAHX01004569.1~~GAHX01004569.1.p1  ORF type:complete len:432 (+),score=97.42 GAHX01004569.1:180-1475(+)
MALLDAAEKIKDTKLHIKHSKDNNKISTKRLGIYSILIVILFIAIVLIFYPKSTNKKGSVTNGKIENNSNKPSSKSTTKTTRRVSVNKEPNNNNPNKITLTPAPSPKTKPRVQNNVIEINQTSFTDMVNTFSSQIKELFNKTYSEENYKDPLTFNHTLEDITVQTYPELKLFISDILLETADAEEIIINENLEENIMSSYYRIMFKYFKIIHRTYSFYMSDEFKTVMDKSSSDLEKSDDAKFMFQQLLLRREFDVIMQVHSKFDPELKKLIIENKLTTEKELIGKKIIEMFDILKTTLFVGKVKTFNFGDKLNDIEIKHLLTKLDGGKKFVILNFYLVYLNIFEVGGDYSVQSINKHFEKIVAQIQSKNTNPEMGNDELNWKKNTLDKCRSVLQGVVIADVNTFEEFIEVFDGKNESCLAEINKLIKMFSF